MRPSWLTSEREFEDYLHAVGFKPQVSFRGGEVVAYGELGSVRPDWHHEALKLAVDVKNYNLQTAQGRSALIRNVAKQVGERNAHLPPGTRQGLILDIRGQRVRPDLLVKLVNRINKKTGGSINHADIYVHGDK